MENGVTASDWKRCEGGKTVEALWKEVKLQECGMELWRTGRGQVLPVRVVHVLRAKVCSSESYERNVFLFNTWQQFGDGRTRTRNGLLSEKLSLAEMPLEDHLREVCTRAVTVEEMQRVQEAAFRVGPGYENPEYDPNYVCPIEVMDERFIDHTIEIVKSASYSTLLTVYHLYTVEIVCHGLPSVDFTTLEFDSPDAKGHRKLKYVHSWHWLEWSTIQRYLFEGSELKERKVKSSFQDAAELSSWLAQFDLELDLWGTSNWKSVKDLFTQVENGETLLEQWGRHDGVPLLMRVVHVVRLEVMSSDPRLLGKLLLLTWQQEPGGKVRTVNRLVTKVANTLNLPFDDQRLKEVAAQTLQEKLGYIVDAHFRMGATTPMPAHLQESGVQIVKASLVDHHVAVEESPSYKGMCTLYHFYDMHVECQGVPDSDFASITLRGPLQPFEKIDKSKVRICQGFRWVTWPCCIDIWREQASANQQVQDALRKNLTRQQGQLKTARGTAERLIAILEQLEQRDLQDPDVEEAMNIAQDLQADLDSDRGPDLLRECREGDFNHSHALPPSMVSTMSQRTILASETLQSATLRRMRLMRKLGTLEEEDDALANLAVRPTFSTRDVVEPGPDTASTRSTVREGSLEDTSSRGSRPPEERIEEAFAQADVKGNGTLTEGQLVSILRQINTSLPHEAIVMALSSANLTRDGTVNYRDFLRWLYEDHSERPGPHLR